MSLSKALRIWFLIVVVLIVFLAGLWLGARQERAQAARQVASEHWDSPLDLQAMFDGDTLTAVVSMQLIGVHDDLLYLALDGVGADSLSHMMFSFDEDKQPRILCIDAEEIARRLQEAHAGPKKMRKE